MTQQFSTREVLDQVRSRLNDTATDANAQSWSDQRLLQLIEDGFRDLALNTDLFIANDFMALQHAHPEYDLSEHVLKFQRFEYDNEILEMRSDVFMDTNYGKWTDRTGTDPQYIVYSNRIPGKFRVFPIPDFGTAPTPPDIPDNGIITSLGPTPVSPPLVSDASSFGDAGNPVYISDENARKYLRIFYIRRAEKPAVIPNVQGYNLDRQYLTPLIYYVTSEAYRDDAHGFDPNRSTREREYYRESLQNLRSERAADFSGRRAVSANYRPLG